jgi:hypothetical protein
MSYVIYISSKTGDDSRSAHNAYGYWLGKLHTFGGEKYPACLGTINSHTKRYKRKVNAEKMAKNIFDRCGYVLETTVEESK